MKKKYTSKNIVEYILAFADGAGEAITNLKLQKLIYYTQAWYLANFKKPLFDEEFEAWVHGPVIPELYFELRKSGAQGFSPITIKKKLKDVEKEFNAETLKYLSEVVSVYMSYGAYQLEVMTHKEEPWIEARKGLEADEKCDEVISKDKMREFYGKKIED